MYRLLVSIQAEKELTRLKKLYQEAIVAAMGDIKEDPLIGKPLTRDLSGRFSYRVGVYRIIYRVSISEKTVYIITAGPRSSIYN